MISRTGAEASLRVRIVSIGESPCATAWLAASLSTALAQNARSVSTTMSRTMFDSARRRT